MSEDSATQKLPKIIRLGSLPYMLGIGGSKESKDMKLMFIEKGTNKHYTLSIIADSENGKPILDMHAADQAKKAKAIRGGISPKGAYNLLIKIIFDLSALEKDSEKLEKSMVELAISKAVIIEDNEIFTDKVITPISRDNGLLELRKGGKEGHIDDEKLRKLESIHGVEDLDREGHVAATVRGGNRTDFGAVFKKEGKWYYIDMVAYVKEALLLFEPYITIEGKMTKAEFIGALKADTQLTQLSAHA